MSRFRGKKNKGRRGGDGRNVKSSLFDVFDSIESRAGGSNGGTGGKVSRGLEAVFDNLGMKVEWKDGRVCIHRNGRTEVYSDFSELRVPTSKGIKNRQDRLPKPNAVFAERNGVKYYHFPNIGVTVRSCLSYWPDTTEAHPPEHLFGAASNEEFAEAIKAEIESGELNPRAERAYREYRERKWERDVERAVGRALRILARQYGCEEDLVLAKKSTPVSGSLIEEMRQAGFEVRVKF